MAAILLVDDDPFTLGMTEMIMEEEGLTVLTAESGADALARQQEATDLQLVVSDLHMPEMDGLELGRQLRRQGYQGPFVLLTGDGAESLAQENPELDAVLTKDEELAATLPALVARLLA